MGNNLKRRILLGILLLMVGVTTLPLGLMVYGSFKPVGTLTQPAHVFEVVPAWTPKTQTLPLHVDLRKFKTLTFSIQGDQTPFRIGFQDALGNTTLLTSEQIPFSFSSAWEEVSLPIDQFDLSLLNPSLPEKVAETLVVEVPDRAMLHLKDIRFTFKRFTLMNYTDILVERFFGRYFLNSFLVTGIVVLGNILFASMVGYAFARKDFPGKEILFVCVLGSIMIPPQILMVPIFILMKNLQWLNTYWALAVPSLVIPFNVFFMRQYIASLPTTFEDAARIDGASEMGIFFRVVLPLSKPALAVVGINTFISSWNTFLYPFLLTNTAQMRTLPVGLALYKNLQGMDWVHLLAGETLTALPTILIFLIFQRYIIEGITAPSVKRQ